MSPAADFIDGILSVEETIKKISNKIPNSIAILTNLGFIVDKGKSVLSAAGSWKFEIENSRFTIDWNQTIDLLQMEKVENFI